VLQSLKPLRGVDLSRSQGIAMKIRLLLGALVVLSVAASGCQKPPKDPPVATPSVVLSHTRVPLGSAVDMTYEFKVAADAPPFPEDYIVFVHFVDADGELMWTDDHLPPVPTRQWKPGQTIKYSRLLFVPVYPYIGDATIELGLYGKDGKRLVLSGTEKGQRAYEVAKLQVAPQSESVYLTYQDGWHLAEVLPDNSGKEWHWTQKEATLSFKNPKRNAVFFLDYGGQQKVMADMQTATVMVGNQVVDRFQVGSVGGVRRIPLTVTQLGTEDQVSLRISVDRTFIPAVISGGALPDRRELGLCVFHAYIETR
jgi:hypothetical protein